MKRWVNVCIISLYIETEIRLQFSVTYLTYTNSHFFLYTIFQLDISAIFE